MFRKLLIAALPVAALGSTQTATAAPPPIGGLTQPSGSGGSTCATGRALGGARALNVSPDGHTLYDSASRAQTLTFTIV